MTDSSATTGIVTVRGAALAPYIDAIASLRIAVFREFPYLYDGDRAYEQEYLRTYIASGDAMAVLLLDAGAVVGASTGIPMRDETDAFKRPFIARGHDPERVFYCGESVLLPAYRGRGHYRAFFAGREQHARGLGGFTTVCFAAVVREADHPLRPADHVPLDAVWRHFGYERDSALTTTYSWKDVDRTGPTEHLMEFWIKAI